MDQSRLPELTKVARQVVQNARRPGGLLEKNEFTMGVARRQIAQTMGLEEGGLDGGQWKKAVKENVMKYLDEPDEEPEAGPSRSASPAKKPNVKKARKSNTSVNDDKHDSPVSEPKAASAAKAESPVEKPDAGDESDMSSVYDAPPPKRRKKSTSASDMKDRNASGAEVKKRKKKDSEIEESPNEAKVTELKRIVVACGVRKQWAKEFADYPTTSGQIRHLHNILSDLGMKGNPTMGKAKSLKEKRELAAELNDVREFEAKRGVSKENDVRASRSSSKREKPVPEEEGSDVEVADEEDPAEKERSALDSVMDFLGDQSD